MTVEIKFNKSTIKHGQIDKYKYYDVIELIKTYLTNEDIDADITIKFDEKKHDPKKFMDLIHVLKRHKASIFRYD